MNPVPVSTARALGAEFAIAMNVLPFRDAQKPASQMHAHLQLVHAADVRGRRAIGAAYFLP